MALIPRPVAMMIAATLTVALGAGSAVAQQQPDNFTVNRDAFASSPKMMTEFDHIMWGQGSVNDRIPGMWAGFRASPDPSYSCPLATKTKRLCDNKANARCASDGASIQPPFPPDLARARTGISTDQVFMPMCPGTGKRGDTFVALSQDEDDGGVGVYLRSGQGDDGRPAFLQISPNTHADIQGIYVNFRATYMKADQLLHPFHGAGVCKDQACREAYKLRISTDQTYAVFDDSGVSGAFQIFRVVLRNKNGTPKLLDDSILNLGLRTFCDLSSVSKRKDDTCPSRVAVDPNQGKGQQYYAGQVGPSGTETTVTIKHDMANSPFKARLFTSHGDTTGDAPFTERHFEVTISWAQFVSMLRGVAYSNGQDGATNEGVAAVFGPGWADPENWMVQNVQFGQELSNRNWNGSQPSAKPSAASGGSMRQFTLTAEKP